MMRLTYEEHLSAKTQQSVELTLSSGADPAGFVVDKTERQAGEGEATTTTYEFPDDLVVTAVITFGDAVALEPDEPVSLDIEVHIGPKADPAIAAAAEAAARQRLDEGGLPEVPEGGLYDIAPRLSVVRH